MPTRFWGDAQRARYGMFPEEIGEDDLARCFHLDARDLAIMEALRGDHNRLGFGVQLGTVRYIGVFPSPETMIPSRAIKVIADQLDARQAPSLDAYWTGRQRWRHVALIKDRYDFRDFTIANFERFRLMRWLYALCLAGDDRPGLLMDRAIAWLLAERVLLPGVSTVERLCARIRSRVQERRWHAIAKAFNAEQSARISGLLADSKGAAMIEELRRAPRRLAPGEFMSHLERIDAIREENLAPTGVMSVPAAVVERLARSARKIRPAALLRLPDPRRPATLAALFSAMEGIALDEAIELFDQLITQTRKNAAKDYAALRMRSLRDLDAAALILARVAGLALIDVSDEAGLLSARDELVTEIDTEKIREAIDRTNQLARPPDDRHFQELCTYWRRVKRLFNGLLQRVEFSAAPSAEPVREALEFLSEISDWTQGSPLDRLEEPPELIDLRRQIHGQLPKGDLPDILLEVFGRANLPAAFAHVTDQAARVDDFEISLAAALIAEGCNIGFEPMVRPEIPALRRDHLSWVSQNFIRDETLRTANAILVAAHDVLSISKVWGHGDVVSADGMRFVVRGEPIHAGYNPKYFGRKRGVTWYNLVSDQSTGLGGVAVPGTLRDSMVILGLLLEQETHFDPSEVMTDTAAYSDVVFGLFWLLGYRFCPRLADIGSTRLWRVDRNADYGDLNNISRNKVNTDLIAEAWPDLLPLAGSLKLGRIKADAIMRFLQIRDRQTPISRALAELGRMIKTIHILDLISDPEQRRRILIQLNRQEFRHALARRVCHGNRGEVAAGYKEGQEETLGALGLMLNVIGYWNATYMQAIIDSREAPGTPIDPALLARVSPLTHRHINFLGRYSFNLPDAVARGELRPLRKL